MNLQGNLYKSMFIMKFEVSIHCLYYAQTQVLQWWDLFLLNLCKISAIKKETIIKSMLFMSRVSSY